MNLKNVTYLSLSTIYLPYHEGDKFIFTLDYFEWICFNATDEYEKKR